jgi:hypothetical protein
LYLYKWTVQHWWIIAILALGIAVMTGAADGGCGDTVEQEQQYIVDIVEDVPGTLGQMGEDLKSPAESLQEGATDFIESGGFGDGMFISKMIEDSQKYH